MVSALAFSARGHGFDPHSRRVNVSVSEHVFLSVICRDDTRYVHRPLDRYVNLMPPCAGRVTPCAVKEPSSSLHDYL